jgi:hypothetical protein
MSIDNRHAVLGAPLTLVRLGDRHGEARVS